MRKKLYPVLKAAKEEKRTAWVALPRPRDNCFPSLRIFNGRINQLRTFMLLFTAIFQGSVVCFTNQISSMRSQSTPLKFRGKSSSFCSYFSCFCFLSCFVLIFPQSILLPFPKGESDPGHINLYFCLRIVQKNIFLVRLVAKKISEQNGLFFRLF